MFIWLWNFLVGQYCHHKWSLYSEIAHYDDTEAKMPVYRKYVLQCAKCGNFKKKKI